MTHSIYDVAVIGGGPGGLSAAVTAAELGAKVVLVDESPGVGGQIWRSDRGSVPAAARHWIERLNRADVDLRPNTTVWQVTAPGTLETSTGRITARQTILACGARELFLPFPGWELPGVTGVGGLQALVHSGLDIDNRRVVLAGSGPLLLQVASTLERHGAQVLRVAEQAPLGKLMTFSLGLGASKTWQALTLANRRFRPSSWPLEALGEQRVEGVRLQVGQQIETLDCDFLAVGFGLVPNLELPRAFGCEVTEQAVAVDGEQRTSISGIFAVGEVCGVKGAPGAIADGTCAGFSATSTPIPAGTLGDRNRQRRFQNRLTRAFAIREEVRTLASPATILCRCEQVRVERVTGHSNWTSAKQNSRCGMGLCQGRVCGAATEVLYGWGPRGVRPPMIPVPVGALFLEDNNDSESGPGR